MPRPSKCTTENIDAICTLVKAGVPVTYACAQRGIHRDTLHGWWERGRLGEEPYASALDRFSEAEGTARSALSLLVAQAARNDWRAAAWWIDRVDPPKSKATAIEDVIVVLDEILQDPEITDECRQQVYRAAARRFGGTGQVVDAKIDDERIVEALSEGPDPG